MSKKDKERYDRLLADYRALQSFVADMVEQPRFKWQDCLTLVGVVLTLAGYVLENAAFVTGCFAISTVLICISVRGHKEWKTWRYLVCIVVVGMFSYCSFHAYDLVTRKELSALTNRLVPSNESTPPNACGDRYAEGSGLLILMGGVTSYVDQFPHTIVSVDDTPRLTVNKKGDFAQISLDVFGPDGKIIASLDDDGFNVRQGSFFKFQRKDKSSLRIVDEYNEEVLNVRYINPKAIWINAILRYPGSKPVIIQGSAGDGICTAHAGVAEINVETREKKH